MGRAEREDKKNPRWRRPAFLLLVVRDSYVSCRLTCYHVAHARLRGVSNPISRLSQIIGEKILESDQTEIVSGINRRNYILLNDTATFISSDI